MNRRWCEAVKVEGLCGRRAREEFQIDWYQKLRKRKSLYWQGEAAYARVSAEEYAQLLTASTGDVSEPRDRLFNDETSGEDYNA